MEETHSPPGRSSLQQFFTHQPVRAEGRLFYTSARATMFTACRSQRHLLPASLCCSISAPGAAMGPFSSGHVDMRQLLLWCRFGAKMNVGPESVSKKHLFQSSASAKCNSEEGCFIHYKWTHNLLLAALDKMKTGPNNEVAVAVDHRSF